jgi:hypothetical protein
MKGDKQYGTKSTSLIYDETDLNKLEETPKDPYETYKELIKKGYKESEIIPLRVDGEIRGFYTFHTSSL